MSRRPATGRAALVLLLACGQQPAPLSGTVGAVSPEEGGFLHEPLPGALPVADGTLARLRDAWAKRDPGYRPRTRHVAADGTPRYTNRLLLEASPYLRQHAHNPTDWFPWSDEAFERARRLGRPVLLSVGYSTCHWCHVMEEESFDDEEIARVLNERYVAIKVDREMRPDVDSVYMTAVRMLTGGGGGWPMTVWLTPNRQPFFGGTYFPARDGDRGVRTGFLTLLGQLREVYDQQPERVAASAEEITRAIAGHLTSTAAGRPDLPGAEPLHALAADYRRSFDTSHGGIDRAPKFPSGLSVRFLLRHHRRTGDARSLEMATLTLDKMAGGGLFDQIGGGFHRYSTDARWLVPHFEKMLYDNALLVMAYLEAWQASGREDFARVARETLRYVARDMTSPEGAFYSATDADSLTPDGHREEGRFFTWAPAELDAALDPERARLVKAHYAVTPRGNFEGRSILHAPRPLAEVARELGLSPERARALLDEARETLYRERARRPPPLRDEKVLAAWNGLMISAHARAALVLDEPEHARRAARAAGFVLDRMRRDGRLLRSFVEGAARHNGFLDDYAFLTAGLIDLYEATSEPRWLREAIALDRIVETHYQDGAAGGFFLTSDDHEALLAREKPGYDGAEPSGNSVQALNLLRLHELTSDDRYRRRAESTLVAFAHLLGRHPAGLSEMALALDYHLDTPKQVVIVAPSSRDEAEPLLARLRGTFLPNRVLSVVSEGAELERQLDLIPLLENKQALGGRPTAYVCERRVCERPTSDPDLFAAQLAKVERLSERPRQ